MTDVPDVEVLAIDDPFQPWTHEVHVDEELAGTSDAVVPALVAHLGTCAGIVEAVHEDREVVLVRAAGRGVDEVEDLVTSWLRRHLPHES